MWKTDFFLSGLLRSLLKQFNRTAFFSTKNQHIHEEQLWLYNKASNPFFHFACEKHGDDGKAETVN